VDLHHTLVGVGSDPAELWGALSGSTETMAIAGTEVEVLDRRGAAFCVALHAAQHGGDERKSLADLERALERIDGAEWSAAASLARDLDATEAFAAGLRLTPAGRRLADELGLPVAASVDTLLRARSAVPPAEGMERLARTPGIAAKLRLLGREI